MKLNSTKHSILVSICILICQGKKHYATIGPSVFLDLLQKHHKTEIKERWLFSCLRTLEDNKLMTRIKRYSKDTDGNPKQLPSCFALTLKGAYYLYKKGVTLARGLIDKIKSWLKRRDNRPPEKEQLLPEFTPQEATKNLIKLRELMATIGG